MAIPDGLDAASLDSILNKASLDEKLTSQQQKVHKESALWPDYSSDKKFSKRLEEAMQDVSKIRVATETTAKASTYALREENLKPRKNPTADDLLRLNAGSSLGFLLLDKRLQGFQDEGKKSKASISSSPIKSLFPALAGGLAAGGLVALLASAFPSIGDALFDAQALRSDPEIQEIRKEYLRAYASSVAEKKTELIEGVGGSIVAGAAIAGSAIGEMAASIVVSLAGAVMDASTVLTDPEIQNIRTSYLRRQAAAIADAKLDLYEEGGAGKVIAVADVVGATLGNAAAGLITSVAGALMDASIVVSDPVIQLQRLTYLRKQAELIIEDKTLLYESGAGTLVALGDLVGQTVGNIAAGAIESLATAAFNVVDIFTDNELISRRRSFLLAQLDAIYAAKLDLYGTGDDPALGSHVVAVADLMGRSVASIAAGAIEAVAVSAFNVADIFTDDALIEKRRQFLSSQLDAIYAAKMDIYGTGEDPALGGHIVAVADLMGRSVTSIAAGAVEAIATSAFNVADIVTDKKLIEKRRAFLDQQLDSMYAAKLDVYGTGKDNVGWGSKVLAAMEIAGKAPVSFVAAFLSTLSEEAFNTELITTDPYLRAKRVAYLAEQIDAIFEAQEDQREGFWGGLTEGLKAAGQAAASFSSGSEMEKALAKVFNFQDEELKPLRVATAQKYADAADAAAIPSMLFSRSTAIAAAVESALQRHSSEISFDWDAPELLGSKVELAKKYMTALTDAQVAQLNYQAANPKKDGALSWLFGTRAETPAASINANSLANSLYSDTVSLTAANTTIQATTVAVSAENLQQQIEEPPLTEDVLAEQLSLLGEAISMLATRIETFKPEITTNNTTVQATDSYVNSLLMPGTAKGTPR